MSIGPEYKKKYGLIIPKSKQAAPVKKRPLSSVFNVDSDEEEEAPARKPVPSTAFKNMKRQAKIDIQRALEEDPSVYQYDEIYDSMKEEKEKKVAVAKQDKTSKYAKNLIRNAAIRKLENDRHFERKCQRELEDEGDEFADKESFITSSYKNKLAELAVLEEEHKRMAEEEKRNDVTKKRDLTDFYRDILSQRTSEVASSVASSVAQSQEKHPPATSSEKETEPAAPEQKELTSTTERPVIKKVRTEKQRTYRSRRVTSNSDHAASQETGSEGGSDSDEDSVEPENQDNLSSEVKSAPEKGKSDKAEVEENLDKDDSDSSDSDDEEDEEKEENEKEEQGEVVGEAGLPEVKKFIISEEEQREERIKLVKESCKKRNTPETIQAAIERYWKRQAAIST